MSLELKGELKHLGQEQDRTSFKGEKQDYKFSGLPFYMTRTFAETFKKEYLLLAWHTIHMINRMKGEKERIQVFTYEGKMFYVVSNWENGTEADDYEDSDELSAVFMMPSDN